MTVSDPLPSSLGPIDRSAEERSEPGLIERLRADPQTLVMRVRGDRTPVGADGALLPARVAEADSDAEWAFLGRTRDGRGVLVASSDPAGGDDGWRALREIGGDLPAGESDALVMAVAIGRWLRDAAFCPACGTRTVLANAGWSRSCPHCGREHFPRTDPAIIVAVGRADDPDRLLLGSNALWGGNRYSCFAGFAEAGESLEDAVVREIEEEAGIRVGEIRYLASQGWPYPRSLMLGFFATAEDPDTARGDGEEIVDARWFTRAEIGEALAGRGPFTLPGNVSIAHRLIRTWFEA